VSAFAAAPIALHCASPGAASAAAAVSGADEHECCRNLRPGQTCPMHKQTRPAVPAEAAHAHDHGHAAPHAGAAEAADPAGAGAGTSGCVLRDACAPADAALLALAGGTALVPRSPLVAPAHATELLPLESAAAIGRGAPPDAPPPRA
jgi:hypothetical protein